MLKLIELSFQKKYSIYLLGCLLYTSSVLLSVVSNRQLPRLEKLAHAIDPTCFMIVSQMCIRDREERARFFTKIFRTYSSVLFCCAAGIIWLCRPAKRQITFALQLYNQPPAAQIYVVVHEYCHFLQ